MSVLGIVPVSAYDRTATVAYAAPLEAVSTPPAAMPSTAVVVTFDSQALVMQGRLAGDCGDLQVVDAATNTPLPTWLEPGTCQLDVTRVWVDVGRASPRTVALLLVFGGDVPAGNASLPVGSLSPDAVTTAGALDTRDFAAGEVGATPQSGLVLLPMGGGPVFGRVLPRVAAGPFPPGFAVFTRWGPAGDGSAEALLYLAGSPSAMAVDFAGSDLSRGVVYAARTATGVLRLRALDPAVPGRAVSATSSACEAVSQAGSPMVLEVRQDRVVLRQPGCVSVATLMLAVQVCGVRVVWRGVAWRRVG